MRLTGEDKNSIREMLGSGDLDSAIKQMLKHRMRNYEELRIKDKLFLNYNLSWAYKKSDNFDLSKHYIGISKTLFDCNTDFQNTYKIEYYNYLWIYTELHKGSIGQLAYNNAFMQIYKYHKKMNNKRYACGALQMMVFRTNDKLKIINFMKEMIDTEGCREIATDMVEDCKDIDDHIYIEVKTYLENAIASIKVANLY